MTAITPLCKTVIEDQFDRLCQPLQVIKKKDTPTIDMRRISKHLTQIPTEDMPKVLGPFDIFYTSSPFSRRTHSAHTNNLMQDAYNMTYKAWAIMVLIPLILTTILVMIAWGEVSLKKE